MVRRGAGLPLGPPGPGGSLLARFARRPAPRAGLGQPGHEPGRSGRAGQGPARGGLYPRATPPAPPSSRPLFLITELCGPSLCLMLRRAAALLVVLLVGAAARDTCRRRTPRCRALCRCAQCRCVEVCASGTPPITNAALQLAPPAGGNPRASTDYIRRAPRTHTRTHICTHRTAARANLFFPFPCVISAHEYPSSPDKMGHYQPSTYSAAAAAVAPNKTPRDMQMPGGSAAAARQQPRPCPGTTPPAPSLLFLEPLVEIRDLPQTSRGPLRRHRRHAAHRHRRGPRRPRPAPLVHAGPMQAPRFVAAILYLDEWRRRR